MFSDSKTNLRYLRHALLYTQVTRHFSVQCIVRKHVLTEEERRLLEALHLSYQRNLVVTGLALLGMEG